MGHILVYWLKNKLPFRWARFDSWWVNFFKSCFRFLFDFIIFFDYYLSLSPLFHPLPFLLCLPLLSALHVSLCLCLSLSLLSHPLLFPPLAPVPLLCLIGCSLISSSSFFFPLYSYFTPTMFRYTILSPSKCMHLHDYNRLPLSFSIFISQHFSFWWRHHSENFD